MIAELQTREDRLAELAKAHRCWDDSWPGVEDTTPGLIELCHDWIKPDMRMVEVGCFAGVSTEIFALHAKTVYAIDPWESDGEYFNENELYDAEQRFDGLFRLKHLLDSQVRKWKMPSLEAAAIVADGVFDAVYLDGDHRPQAVTADIEAWLPNIKPGGLLMGHDHHMIGGALDAAGFKVEKVYSDTSWVVIVTEEMLRQTS